MRVLREAIKTIAIIFIAAVVFFRFILPAISPTQKLTGNRAALALCNWELTTWKAYQTNSPGFDFHQLADDQKRRVIMFGLNQDFSIRTNFVWSEAGKRKLVLVSAREYESVPTLAPWHWVLRNPSHAVGYSDGTTGLISQEQFDSLNLYGFASLWSLATNPDFKIFKQ